MTNAQNAQNAQNDLIDRLRNIRILFSDVDGIFTDGRTWQNAQGEWRRVFSVRDTLAVRGLRRLGVRVVVLSAQEEASAISEIRSHLDVVGIDQLILNCRDKMTAIDRVLAQFGLTRAQAAFIVQNGKDISILNEIGLTFAPSDCSSVVSRAVDHVIRQSGGDGAVMEVCGLLSQAISLEQNLIEQNIDKAFFN